MHYVAVVIVVVIVVVVIVVVIVAVVIVFVVIFVAVGVIETKFHLPLLQLSLLRMPTLMFLLFPLHVLSLLFTSSSSI